MWCGAVSPAGLLPSANTGLHGLGALRAGRGERRFRGGVGRGVVLLAGLLLPGGTGVIGILWKQGCLLVPDA